MKNTKKLLTRANHILIKNIRFRTTIYLPVISLLLLLISFALTGCGQNNASLTPVSRTGIYFDTAIGISLYSYSGSSNTILDESMRLCRQYEDMLSSTVEGSDIWKINHSSGNPTEVSLETAALLERSLYYCELSEGKLDITLGGVSQLWNFSQNAAAASPVPPKDTDISEALSHVNYRNVIIEYKYEDGNTSPTSAYVTLTDADARIELGFIAKGYIADRLSEQLRKAGVTSGIINLGGNVLCIGSKPDGTPFKIGLQKPFDDMGEYLTTVNSDNTAVVSSGVYERYYYCNNTLYHHILDSSTGYPIYNGLYGVSVISSSATDADALSTLCFILGKDDAITLIEALPDTEAIFITDKYEVIKSSGL